MPNSPTRLVNTLVVATRAGQVPLASFSNGMNQGASNTPGIGIATAGEIQTQNLDQSAPNWTLNDQDGDPRTPQNSQYLGGSGLNSGSSGKGATGIQIVTNDPSGDGSVTVDGAAHLASLAAGWTTV